MNILQKLLLLVTVFTGSLLLLGSATPVSAQVFSGAKGEACKGANLSNADADCKTGGPNGANATLEKRISAVINILSIIVGVVAVILIIVNGLRFITSNGDANSVASARNGVIYAMVGLIIAALAQVIVRFVLARF